MKKVIRLTESDLGRIVKRVINESRVGLIKDLIKSQGMDYTIQAVGGFDNLRGVLNINNPMDFLHLFDDLSTVKSIKHPYMDIFRYEKGENIMSYDREDGKLYVSWLDIWKVLKDNYELNPDELRGLIKKWVQNEFKIGNIRSILNISLLYDDFKTIN